MMIDFKLIVPMWNLYTIVSCDFQQKNFMNQNQIKADDFRVAFVKLMPISGITS